MRIVDEHDLAVVAAALADLDEHDHPIDEHAWDFGSLEEVPRDLVAGHVARGSSPAIEAQDPPGVDGVIVIGTDDGLVEVVEFPVETEHVLEPLLGDRTDRCAPLRAEPDEVEARSMRARSLT